MGLLRYSQKNSIKNCLGIGFENNDKIAVSNIVKSEIQSLNYVKGKIDFQPLSIKSTVDNFGDQKTLVIIVDTEVISDELPHLPTVQQAKDLLFGTAENTLQDYYKTISNGQV